MKIKFLICMAYLSLLILASCTSDETDARHNDAQMNDNLFEDSVSDTLNQGSDTIMQDNVETQDQ